MNRNTHKIKKKLILINNLIIAIILFFNEHKKNMNRGDVIIKAVIIGNSGVGKSSIVRKYQKMDFIENHISTIGVDYCTKVLIKNAGKFKKTIKLQLWDTAGQERFRSIARGYYKEASYAVFVYDVTDIESFKNIQKWLNDVDTYGNDNLDKILIGNKFDLKRVVSTAKGSKFASLNGFFKFFEASAKTGYNMDALFDSIESKIRGNWNKTEKENESKLKSNRSQVIKLNNDEKNNNNSHMPSNNGCC